LLTAVVPDAASHLRPLRHADVLVQESTSDVPGQLAYRFGSELLRRAVLQMIPFSERPGLHLRIATWLEQHAPLPFSEAIASHFERGGAAEAAYAHYLAGAGEAFADGDRLRAERLYHALTRLDVDAAAQAQAALAHAEAALTWRSLDTARAELHRAERIITSSARDADERLREAYARLSRDLEIAEQVVQAVSA